jgi:hypothetical protein
VRKATAIQEHCQLTHFGARLCDNSALQANALIPSPNHQRKKGVAP